MSKVNDIKNMKRRQKVITPSQALAETVGEESIQETNVDLNEEINTATNLDIKEENNEGKNVSLNEEINETRKRSKESGKKTRIF